MHLLGSLLYNMQIKSW